MSRRSFVGSALAGAGAVMVGRRLPARASAGGPADVGAARRVVVGGAGLAGLTAALDLMANGWSVVVVEARDRVGGRVHTLSAPFTAGLHAEAGGESIDENHHDLLAMIRRFGLATERRPPQKPYDAVVYYRRRRDRLPTFLAGRGGTVLSDVLRYSQAEAALGDGVDPEHPERAARAEELDRRSLEGFVRDQRLVPEADFIVRLQDRSLYNAELSDISLLFVAQQSAQAASEEITPVDSFVAVETMRINGGNSRLPLAMAGALGTRVRLGSPITRVEHGRHGVRVHAVGQRPIDAAWLVLATPLQPLRRVCFSPALPSSLASVVAGLDLGDAVKVIREYSAAFWLAEGFSGFTLTDLPFGVAWAPTDSQLTPRGLLTEFVTGHAARRASARPATERMRRFQAQLDEVYPEARSLVTPRAATMAWSREPYTGGGYAVYKPGQMAPFFSALRSGAARIRFAGEHTCALAGYMESAVRSGHRAAAEVGSPPPALLS